jgi:hypothetical protein
MVSEPGSPLLGVGSAVIFFILVLMLTRGPVTIFVGMKLASLIY